MDLVELVRSKASEYGIPAGLAVRLVQKESSFDPDATNERTGAAGLMQIMERTALDPGYGVDPLTAEERYDPEASADFGFQYLRAMYDRTGNWEDALRAYNAGLGKVDESRGFDETNDYVATILGTEPFSRDDGQTFVTAEGDYLTRDELEQAAARLRAREEATFRALSRPFIERERQGPTASERLLESLPEAPEERSIFNPLRWLGD